MTIRADAADINKITGGKIRVVADLSNYTLPGTHTVNDVTVSIDGYSDAGVVGEYAIVVSLAEPTTEEDN